MPYIRGTCKCIQVWLTSENQHLKLAIRFQKQLQPTDKARMDVGARWPSGRESDFLLTDWVFEPHNRRVVSFSKTHLLHLQYR